VEVTFLFLGGFGMRQPEDYIAIIQRLTLTEVKIILSALKPLAGSGCQKVDELVKNFNEILNPTPLPADFFAN